LLSGFGKRRCPLRELTLPGPRASFRILLTGAMNPLLAAVCFPSPISSPQKTWLDRPLPFLEFIKSFFFFLISTNKQYLKLRIDRMLCPDFPDFSKHFFFMSTNEHYLKFRMDVMASLPSQSGYL
jgi:hypothetical protein